jgi:hypothetical protein
MVDSIVNIILIAIGILIVGAYVATYIAYRQYLREPFESKSEEKPDVISNVVSEFIHEENKKEKEKDIEPDIPLEGSSNELSFTFGNPIQSVDDYEYNYVFQNESDREMTQGLRNKLMSQYPMHFSVLPPSAPNFVANTNEEFQDKDVSDTADSGRNPYSAISNEDLAPPDTLSREQEERKLLQAYQPKKAGELTTYNIEDAMEIIKKIYDKKGEIPDVKMRENNVYEIVGSRRKDEKIVYEDTDTTADAETTNAHIKIPSHVQDLSESRDPFYEMNDRNTKQDKWNYREWTPGLERMFAPTEPRANWY